MRIIALFTLVAATFLLPVATIARAAEVKPAVAEVAAPFDLSAVQLLDSPFKDARELDRKYLLSLDPDRLLHVFRKNAGLPSTAEPLGGWEAPSCELRGHFVGHYLSAASLMYKSTGDETFKKRVDYMVAEMAKCQTALGGKYLSAFPTSYFDRLESGKQVWAPYYTIHKIMAGLLDANQLCGNAQALEILKGMSAYFKERNDKLSDAQMAVVMRTEFGGMMEALANLYAITGNPDDLALSKRFDHHSVFDPLASGQDKLNGLHANTQIPKMIGSARLYELTGDERYGRIADYFWSEVAGKRSFVIGGNSFGEHFRALGVEAGDLVPTTAETCNTYNMLKLTRRLFELRPDPAYADFYERALYNHILGSIDPDSGMMLYFLSLRPGHFKVYNTPTNSFWCCTGTGVENHAKYGDSIYFHNDDTLWVNLFIPSELAWADKGLTLRQETKFPEASDSTITVKAAKPTKFAMKIRRPYWATSGITVKVNGTAVDLGQTTPSSYATITREWADGDRIDISLPMSLHIHRATDVHDSVAILYGPIVLAGELGTELFPKSDKVANQNDLGNVRATAVPTLVSDSENPEDWLKPVPGHPLEFTATGVAQPNEVTLEPVWRIHHQRYTVYWKQMGTQQWAAHEQEIKAEDERTRAEQARIVDEAGFGEEQPERDHHFADNRSTAGQFQNRFFREAPGGGWFSAQIKVLPDVPQVLRCTYWGSDTGRNFDVLIDDTKVGGETLNAAHPNAFYSVEYAIPSTLLAGKTSVTVKFQARPRSQAGGVFGCAIVKSADQAKP